MEPAQEGAARRRPLMGDALLLSWSNVARERWQDFRAWHSHEHQVGRLRVPGFLRGRRYGAIDASRDFLTCYELEKPAVLTTPDYLAKANAPSSLTRQITQHISRSSRAVAAVLHSEGIGAGGVAVTLRFDATPGGEAQLREHLIERAIPAVIADGQVIAAHFAMADVDVSSVVSEERRGRPTTIPRWIVIVEGMALRALDDAVTTHLGGLAEHGSSDSIERDTYRLEVLQTR